MGRRVLNEMPYVHRFRDRSGTLRRYFRRHGKRIPLPGLPGSPEYVEAYQAALRGTAVEAQTRPAVVPGSFRALAALYFASPDYKGLAPSSRANYRRVLDAFLAEHGHRLVHQMTPARVRHVIGALADRPGAGIVLLKRLRGLLSFAVSIGWIMHNPASRAKSYRSTPFHTWTEDEIAAFEARWPAGTRQRLAFALLLYTGQRGSDVHRMTWADIVGAKIRVTQAKTRTRLVVPLHGDLRAILDATKREHVAILTTAFGQPFSVKGFGQMVSAAIRGAGLPAHCKAHGLRKAAARRLAEAGATAKEIGAVTGHKTLAEIERYTAEADQERLAGEAIRKQSENGSMANPANPIGKPIEKIG